MDEEFEKTRQNHAGRLIHMLSHQLKRRSAMPESGTGLTPMQKHVLTYILFETMVRDIYQKDIEKEFKIRRSTASGILQLMEKKWLYLQAECGERCASEADPSHCQSGENPHGDSDKYQADRSKIKGRDTKRKF